MWRAGIGARVLPHRGAYLFSYAFLPPQPGLLEENQTCTGKDDIKGQD